MLEDNPTALTPMERVTLLTLQLRGQMSELELANETNVPLISAKRNAQALRKRGLAASLRIGGAVHYVPMAKDAE